MAMDIEVAILGTAHPHVDGLARILQQRPGLRMRWVWDSMAPRAAAVAQACGAELAGDCRQALDDPRVQAVMIFSETDAHDDLVAATVQAGKHLYVDKPLAISAERAWRLARLIEQSPRLFSSGFVLRRRGFHQLLRQMIHEGAFGRVSRIRHVNGHDGALQGKFDSPQRNWFTQPSHSGGGGFLDEGTHSADLVMWLLGRRPRRVTAAVGNITGRYPSCEEFGQGMMLFDDGPVATISGSWVDRAKLVTLEISGTEGCAMVVADRDLYLTVPSLPGADGKTPWTQLPAGRDHPQAVFLDAVLGKTTDGLVSAGDAAVAAAVIHTMVRAAAESRWLDVPQA